MKIFSSFHSVKVKQVGHNALVWQYLNMPMNRNVFWRDEDIQKMLWLGSHSKVFWVKFLVKFGGSILPVVGHIKKIDYLPFVAFYWSRQNNLSAKQLIPCNVVKSCKVRMLLWRLIRMALGSSHILFFSLLERKIPDLQWLTCY